MVKRETTKEVSQRNPLNQRIRLLLTKVERKVLAQAGEVVVRDGDYLVTFREDVYTSIWKRDGKFYQKRHTLKGLQLVLEDIRNYCPAIVLDMGGKPETFSFKQSEGTSTLSLERCFSPNEIEPQKELENISKVNLALMRAIRGQSPELWKAAQEYDNPNEAFRKLLKSSQNKK